MAENKLNLEIKDELSLVDNHAAFSDALKKLDAELAPLLSAELATMSNGKKIDRGALLNALYAATKPSAEDESQ